MKFYFSRFVWGIFLLLAAAFLLANQFYNFTDIGIGKIIIAGFALVFIVKCIAHLHFAFFPIPLVVLYIIFQEPLNLPYFQAWTLILASVLASIGLSVIFPRKNFNFKFKHYSKREDKKNQVPVTEDCDYNNNNPSFSVNFGTISRRFFADSLETVQLNCNFGALEIFFDRAELNPNGAEVSINCSFGAVVLFIPKEWQVIDRLNCSLGGVDIDNRSFSSAENAPKLTLTGSVSFGGIEVKQI